MPKFYLTTAIDYSNGDPHLGHALEKVGADCIARYRRLRGDDVHFLMGMDEHSQAVLQAAQEHAVAPKAWVDRMAERFEGFWQRLECSNDDWIRTTEPRHHRTVAALLERIAERNPDDLFVGEYEGLYCIGCEEFKQPSQIVNGRCIEHPTRELIPTKERNHFFRLSRYRDQLLALIGSGEFRVEPAIRRNEVVRLLEDGLQDISVSRNRQAWGIPFPGDPDQTVYVWFDALINYLSATGYPEPGYGRLWPADLHVVGKGITRFHCIIWPAMLLSAGIELPRQVWAHGYVQWEGTKMSKSEGTAVTLDETIDRHGPDALRYFLLREVGFESDGNFTWERFDERYTSDLADGLGNLASRSLAMLAKYRNGLVPAGVADSSLDEAGRETVRAYASAMDALDLRGGAEAAWELVATANLFIQQTAPWSLAKQGEDAELDACLGALARVLYRLAVLGSPFVPGKSQLLWHSLGLEGEAARVPWDSLASPPVAGRATVKPENLFPKPAVV
ncbi:MAG TPA: class I tRNA ligase family protein [Gemmatimonadales bacterium]|nr:class I tRNA ligase family protein [Gemmatimonadales bacterium]